MASFATSFLDKADTASADDALTCISTAFVLPLPENELHRLRSIDDLFLRRKEIYRSLEKHLGLSVRGRSLSEFGALGSVLPCRTIPEFAEYLADDVKSGLANGTVQCSLNCSCLRSFDFTAHSRVDNRDRIHRCCSRLCQPNCFRACVRSLEL